VAAALSAQGRIGENAFYVAIIPRAGQCCTATLARTKADHGVN